MEQKKDNETNTQGGEPIKTNPGDDINANLGKFGNNENAPDMVTPAPTLAVQAVEEELNSSDKKERRFKIDFEKFNRRKQVASKNAFGAKMDLWLRTKKSFIVIWLIILGIVVTVLVTQIIMPIYVNKAIHTDGPGKTIDLATGKASIILSYIAIGFIPLPFLFLLTTWIVGVNGVSKSRTFHYILWFMLLIAVLCMIVSIGCGGYVLNDVNSWNKPWN